MHFLPPDLEAYVNAHTTPDDALLVAIKRETEVRTMMPQMLSGANQGRFLTMLVQLLKPKVCLEVGTFTGYGALCIARGLSGEGHLHTIEINEELKRFHDKYFAEAGLENHITVYYQPAAEVITNIEGPIDFAFIDADKETYSTYLDLLVPMMRSGGLIVADNVLWSGKVIEDEAQDIDTIAVRAFNQRVVDHPELEHVLIPLRDGLLLARKK